MQGELIYQHLWQIEPGQRELIVDGETIPLDPDLSASDNAQCYFERYRKAQSADEQIPAVAEASHAEIAYLEEVANHFGFTEMEFRRIKATRLGPEAGDPYAVLGLLPGASMEEVRQAWRRLAAENHPDRMTQRGAPAEFVEIAREKTAAINAAYAQIRDELAVSAE